MFVAPSVVKITKIAALSTAKNAVFPTINTATLSNTASARAIIESLFLLFGNRCRLCAVRGPWRCRTIFFFFF